MNLSANLKKLIGDYGQTDPEWVQFIYDHRTYLLQNSTVVTLSQEDSYIYRYRPEAYFHKTDIDISKVWITLWLNQLTDICSFKGIETLHVPSDSVVSILKQTYENYRSTVVKL